MADINKLSDSLLSFLPDLPTAGQAELARKLSSFLFDSKSQLPAFVLEGYAGTGKTTIVSSLVKALDEFSIRSQLLAPTGRAAKVLAAYAEKPASTIHRKIYFIHTGPGGEVKLNLAPNKHKNTLFIVDEASMIPTHNSGENSFFREHNLLEDLIEYVFTGENCRLLLLGDPAQLPPVGSNQSPALDIEYLRSNYFLDLNHFILTEVVRQADNSQILGTATLIRDKITSDNENLPIFKKFAKDLDVKIITGDDMLDALNDCYSKFGKENTVVITRSNKRANQYNTAIRKNIWFQENEIATSDLLMVVRNNYFWLPEDSKPGFIANGDTIEIQRINRHEEIYGLNFAHVTIRMTDYPDEPERDVILLLNTLNSESPSLSFEENRRFYTEVLNDYAEFKSKRKQSEAVKNNPYFNALQVKHANALTCHKTQGGQWKAVFIEKGYMIPDMINKEFLRWMYTAVTRATDVLYLVNFDNTFFE